MGARDTNQALAEITDEGLFERIAMAVLRIADPRYVALSHPGVNAKGKTRKGPVDGIGFVPGAKPPHLVAAHHTTTAADGLRDKWLHDPATVKPRKAGGRPTQPAGDVVKTASIVAEERARTPGLRATLVLTTNEEPDEALWRDAVAEGALHQIEVIIWPRSSLAHVLDTTPSGQWLRRKLLGIEQEILSEELLAKLSKASVKAFAPPDDPRAWVPRQLDSILRSVRRPISFLVGESGLGKSIACYRALTEHVEGGGYGLVLPHEVIAQAITFEQSLSEALRRLHPLLLPGQSPLAFCTPDKPLVVVIEDINLSGQPERLAAKIAGWGMNPEWTQAQVAAPWRLFCPVWPRVIAMLDEQLRKLADSMLISLEAMTPAESRHAVIVRASLAGRTVSEIKAEEISSALGHDPLLIALYDFDREPELHFELTRFIEGELARAQASSDDTSTDLRVALLELAIQLLGRRRMEPSWRELMSWGMASETLPRLRRLAQRGKLIRLSGPSTNLQLLFRHDRVREWLLVEAAASAGDDLSDDIISDPFFAEVLGGVIVHRNAPPALLERTHRLNPLALFYALRICPQEQTPDRVRVVNAIEKWLAIPGNFGPAHRQLGWEALAALEATDGPEVIPLVRKFPYRGRSEQIARLRNGNLAGGIEMCLNSEPGTTDPLRDRHLEHAKLRFGDRLIQILDQLLRRDDLDGPSRVGLLRFAGHMGDPRLGAAAGICWSTDPTRNERLDNYLWAFARCCEPTTAPQYLDLICAAWAALPDKSDGHSLSPRDELAANHVRWAFQRDLPHGAIDYFIARAQQPDLRWQITYMLHGLDDSRVATFIVTELAKRVGDFIFRNAVTDHWRRAQEKGRPMSPATRQQFLDIWQGNLADAQQRIAAFDLWAATQEADDLSVLQAAASDVDLADRVLQQRRDRGDRSVVPALIEKIRDRDHGHWWWFNTHRVWNPELTETLNYVLGWRREQVAQNWDEAIEEDWRTQEIITRRPVAEASSLLLRHWDHLRFSRHFVQAALYVGTSELCQLAAASIKDAPKPALLFKHLSSGWHIEVFGHAGITRDSQILTIEPYLHLLSEGDLFLLADACNRHGWFELRRRLFDQRIKRSRLAWSSEGAATHFDSMLKRKYWIDREIDDALKTGVSWDEYLDAMCDWVAERQTFNALQVLGVALAHKGSRRDLSRLKIVEAMPRDAAEALIADMTFAVQRRTPN